MNQFEAARLKFEKKQQTRKVEEAPVKREEPKPVVNKGPEPMTIHISGLPFEMTLVVDYAGTLTSGQVNEQNLRAMFKKCLLPIGRVR
jgi:hypothetical protein